MEEQIAKIWFSESRIYAQTDKNKVLSRPLEAFPLLKNASESDRNHYEISLSGEAVRWREIDEDICLDNFYQTEEPDYNNPTANLFKKTNADIFQIAKKIGIHHTLLQKHIYGIKKPSKQGFEAIAKALER